MFFMYFFPLRGHFCQKKLSSEIVDGKWHTRKPLDCCGLAEPPLYVHTWYLVRKLHGDAGVK